MGAASLTRIITYIEIFLFVVGSLIGLISISLPTVLVDWLLEEEESLNPIRKDEMKTEVGQLTMLVAAGVLTSLLIWLIVLISLYRGSKEKNITQLMCWIIFNCIICALLIFGLLSLLIKSPTSITVLIPIILFIMYRVWSLHIVHTLLNEIRFLLIPTQQQQQQQLYAVQYGQQQPQYAGVGGGGIY